MMTGIAIGLLLVAAWGATRGNNKDRPGYDQASAESGRWMLLLHVRQDLKLIVFILGAILIMLGIAADRLN